MMNSTSSPNYLRDGDSDGQHGVEMGGHQTTLDLSGKLIVKVRLGDDIRRIPIHNEDITYDELVLMMQRVFRGKLATDDDVIIKYKDEDGDLITIFDSSDLSFAIQCSRILKLTIIVNDGRAQSLGSLEVRDVRNELQHLRDTILKLMDRLDLAGSSAQTKESTPDMEHSKGERQQQVHVDSNKTSSKEFDPLTARNLKNNDLTPDDPRGGTPDSVSSLNSSVSQRQRQLETIQQQQQQGPMHPVGSQGGYGGVISPTQSVGYPPTSGVPRNAPTQPQTAYSQGPPQQQQPVMGPSQNVPSSRPQYLPGQGYGPSQPALPSQAQQQQQQGFHGSGYGSVAQGSLPPQSSIQPPPPPQQQQQPMTGYQQTQQTPIQGGYGSTAGSQQYQQAQYGQTQMQPPYGQSAAVGVSGYPTQGPSPSPGSATNPYSRNQQQQPAYVRPAYPAGYQ